MSFQTEIELVTSLKHVLSQIFNNNCFEIFEEVSLGYGIADLVVSNLKEPISQIEANKIALNNSDINIYNLINKSERISYDDILDITRSSKKEIFQSLDKLVANSYIKIEDSKFIIDKEYELPFHVNFAVEAKLKDWRRALSQAYRYRWFADYSYVVIDEEYSKRAMNNLNLFEKYNVGLASISTEGNFKRVFNPIRSKPFDYGMQILFSEKILQFYELAR